jgi:hypothetical protein
MRIRNTGYNVPYGMGSYLGSLLSPIASYHIDSKTFRHPKPITIQKLPYQLKIFLYDLTRIAKNGIPVVFFVVENGVHFSYVDWPGIGSTSLPSSAASTPFSERWASRSASSPSPPGTSTGCDVITLPDVTSSPYRMWRHHHPTGCDVITLGALVSLLNYRFCRK